MKRILTLTALLGTVSLASCSGLPECSSSDLDGCGRDMAYTEERTVPAGQHVAAAEPAASETMAPMEAEETAIEPMPEPEPVTEPAPAPAPEPVDTQVMRQADEPSYVKGMSK